MNIDLTKYKSEDKIAIACSGGPDSMCLLDLLMKEFNHNQIICIHINHNIRQESKIEEEYIKKYCDENNIMLELKTLHETDISEENLRNKRYEFFKNIIKKYNLKLLFMAHHNDDLIETVLMRITRGSNLKGYLGFEKEMTVNNFTIVRPLVEKSKEEIIKYNQENKIKFFTDLSNNDVNYTRNKIRHKVLPILKEINPNLKQSILNYNNELQEVNNYINKRVDKLYEEEVNNYQMNLTEILKEEDLIIKKIIEKYLSFLYKDNINMITKKHVNNIIDMINKNTNSSIDLPLNITLIKEYKNLRIKKEKELKEYKIVLENQININNKYLIEKVKDEESKSNNVIRLLSDEIKLPLYIKSYTKEDVIEIKNLNGSKKITDIFTNEKLPKDERGDYPILVDNENKVLWIPNIKKSKFDKEKNERYDIIIKSSKIE